jgi:hypothetical protein
MIFAAPTVILNSIQDPCATAERPQRRVLATVVHGSRIKSGMTVSRDYGA